MTAPIGTYWTRARLERLRTLANGTRGADTIAEILGGITRNAVISKVHRTEGLRLRTLSAAGLERAARNRDANPQQKRRKPQRRVKRAVPSPQAEPAPSLILPPVELEEDEEWPPFVGLWKVDTPPEVLRLYQLIGEDLPAELIGHPQAAGVRKSASR